MANLVNTGINIWYPEVSSTLAVTNVTGSVNIGSVGDNAMLANDGYVTAYYAFGQGASTATAGGVVTASSTGSASILAGERLQVRIPPGMDTMSGITDSGTTVLRISRGSGQ